MHKRMDRLYGTASQHACVDCGQPASHWSYTHDDPNQMVSSNGYLYSQLPEHYQPRCVPCHRVFDSTHLQ